MIIQKDNTVEVLNLLQFIMLFVLAKMACIDTVTVLVCIELTVFVYVVRQ